jgi:secreted Zn-dependent insulinase-like peptidase
MLMAMGNGGRRRYWVAVAAILLGGCGSTDPGVTASEANQPSVVGNAQFTNDPSVRILTLTNGLTVYLRENDRPGASAEMRLVINAGSGQEDADQSATAHFLEHMLFNGTTKFPANALIDTLRGFGMQFGADVNAYTTYDETVYELTVPTDEAANLGTGLDVLREWLSAATLDPQQVDDEKGIVLDEWRQSDQTFAGRTAVKAEELFLKGSGYEGHSTGGTDTAIKAMTPELLRRFYDTRSWSSATSTWTRSNPRSVIASRDWLLATKRHPEPNWRWRPSAHRPPPSTWTPTPRPATSN